MRLLPSNRGGQPEVEIRLAVMVGESIYENVRLRLTANRTYRFRDSMSYTNIVYVMVNSISMRCNGLFLINL